MACIYSPSVYNPIRGWHSSKKVISELHCPRLPLSGCLSTHTRDFSPIDLRQIQFARANSLAGYKSTSTAAISKTASIIQYVVAETVLHLDYCSRFGLTQTQVEETEESLACTAYTRFVLDIGMSQDLFALQVAMAPCLLGYQEVALRLAKEGKKDDNIYWEWVENYSGKGYGEAVIKSRELLEASAQDIGVKKIGELVAIFAKATKMERNFWEAGLECS